MTSLTTWKPLHDLFSTRREIDRFFDNVFGNQGISRSTTDSAWAPPVDVVDAEDHVEFHAEVPGLSEDHVQVSVTENVLTIKGEKKSGSEDKNAGYHFVERSYGQFQRSFSLPKNLRTDDIDASFRRGVLTISMPKTKKEEASERNSDSDRIIHAAFDPSMKRSVCTDRALFYAINLKERQQSVFSR